MSRIKIAGVFATALFSLYIAFAAGRLSVPIAVVAPTISPVVAKSDGDNELMADTPMVPIEESTAAKSKDAAARKAGVKVLNVAEILERSRGYRAGGGGFDVQLLWHAQSPEEIMAWAREAGIYPFKQWPAKNPEVLILRSTEGSMTVTQQTLYSFICLAENQWELRDMSVVVGDGDVVMTFNSSNYAAYARTRGGELLSAISFVGYEPTPKERAERQKRDENAMVGIEIQ